MITDSPILAKGMTFPPSDTFTGDRLRRYKFSDLLYSGRHRQAFNTYSCYLNKSIPREISKLEDAEPCKPEKVAYEVYNLPKLIINVLSDLAGGGDVRIKSSNNTNAENAARRILRSNHGNTLYYESIKNSFRYGVSILGLRVGKRHPDDERSTIIIDEVSPWNFFPEYSGNTLNAANIIDAVSIVYGEGKDSETVQLLKVERHTRGLIEYLVYQTKQGKIEYEVLPDNPLWGLVWGDRDYQDETGVNDWLFRIIPNDPDLGEWHGEDEFSGIENLIDRFNKRYGRYHDTLDKFASPILTIPESLVKRNQATGHMEFNMSDVIPVGGLVSGDDIKYIQWEANLQSVENSLNTAEEMILKIAQVNPALLGKLDGNIPESGTALRMRLLNSLSKAQRKISYYKDRLAELLLIGQQLEVQLGIEIPYINGTVSPDPINIITPDPESGIEFQSAQYIPAYPEIEISLGLPIDVRENISNATNKLLAGLSTMQDAYREANPLSDPSEIETKIEQIKQERIDAALAQRAPQVTRSQPADLNNIRNQKPQSIR